MYTEERGHQTFIVNGVRKAKAITPAAFLQVLTIVDIVAYYHEHKKINRVREIRLNHTWQSIPFDMRKSAVITCLAEICSKCIRTSDPHPELFSFLYNALIEYDEPGAYDRDFLIRFLVSLSQFLGFGMEVRSPKANGVYFDLMEGHIIYTRPNHNYIMPIEDLNHLHDIIESGSKHTVSKTLDIRRRLVDQLILYYQLHIESLKEVNSLHILRQLH